MRGRFSFKAERDTVSAMHRYRGLRVFAVLALTAEFVIGLGGYLTPRHEIFPFASWFLFSLVPFQSSDYDLLIHPAEDGGAPLPLNQAGKYVSSSHSIVAFQLIQQLGQAQEDHDADLVRRLRQQIEPRFRVPGLRYDLVKVRYAPIPRWTSGAVLSQALLASFTAGEETPADVPPPSTPAARGARR
jgi:hypothetical protein